MTGPPVTGSPDSRDRRGARRATSPGWSPAAGQPEESANLDRAAEDTDVNWGQWREDGPSDDERILREKPPHWA